MGLPQTGNLGFRRARTVRRLREMGQDGFKVGKSEERDHHWVGKEPPLVSDPNPIAEVFDPSGGDLASDRFFREVIEIKTGQRAEFLAANSVDLSQAEHDRLAGAMFRIKLFAHRDAALPAKHSLDPRRRAAVIRFTPAIDVPSRSRTEAEIGDARQYV